MTYIEKVKDELEGILHMKSTDYEALLDVYALLVLTKGKDCTNEDVHDAWSIWQNMTDDKHRSLVPFDELTKEVQDLDELYKNAIVKVATKSASDGYHTFEELYEFRKVYNAALFNAWAPGHTEGFDVTFDVHKSKKHFDGEDCFGGGWFIVVAILPEGQITNHYKMEDWDLFNIPETEKAKYEFDGHTPQDVLDRLYKLIK